MKKENLFNLVLFIVAAALAVMACAAVFFSIGRTKEKTEIKDFIERNDPSKIIFQKTESKAASDRGRNEIDGLVETGNRSG
ncbi:MAG TPA: hypothetical protein DCZ94_05335 [Lentisphaeria bacterium]|nr:hypothetical protein [Lentisphaeria bacterium]